MCLCNNYCSEIRKLLVEICDSLHIAFHLIIETSSTQQDCCKLLVACAGTLDPGVPGSLQLMTASRQRGSLEPGKGWRRDGPRSRLQSQLWKHFLLLLLKVSVLGDGTEHVFCHLQNLLSGCLGGIMKLAVEENKDIVD